MQTFWNHSASTHTHKIRSPGWRQERIKNLRVMDLIACGIFFFLAETSSIWCMCGLETLAVSNSVLIRPFGGIYTSFKKWKTTWVVPRTSNLPGTLYILPRELPHVLHTLFALIMLFHHCSKLDTSLPPSLSYPGRESSPVLSPVWKEPRIRNPAALVPTALGWNAVHLTRGHHWPPVLLIVSQPDWLMYFRVQGPR